MRIKPHRSYSAYRLPAFIIHASDQALTVRTVAGDTRVTQLEEWCRTGIVLYSCVSPDNLLLYGHADRWSIRTWNGRVSAMSYADVKIYPLTADGWDDTIVELFDYVDSYGIAASSLNTMSLNLWRTTLSHSVTFHEECPLDDMLGPVAVLTGGRKEAKPGVYRNRIEVDMTTAYPTALAMGVPHTLTPAPDDFVKRMDLTKFEGIAQVRVRIPTLSWGPIPVLIDRKAQVTSYGFTKPGEWISVTLPLSELRMAAEVGCEMVADKVHIATGRRGLGRDTFAVWGDSIVPELRNLSGMGGALGKLVANRLWSCFAVSPWGTRQDHTFTAEGVMVTTPCQDDSVAQIKRRAGTAYVGSIVQGRVRERLYREGLGRLSGVVYVDTDGVVCRPTDIVLDGWRTKTTIRQCDIAGPQAMVYTCDDCGKPGSGRGKHDSPHWTVAGAQTIEAKSRLFRQIKDGAITAFNIGNVLAPCDVVEARRHAATETKDREASQAVQYLETL